MIIFTNAVINKANAPSILDFGTTYIVSDPIAIINPKYVINTHPGAEMNIQYYAPIYSIYIYYMKPYLELSFNN